MARCIKRRSLNERGREGERNMQSQRAYGNQEREYREPARRFLPGIYLRKCVIMLLTRIFLHSAINDAPRERHRFDDRADQRVSQILAIALAAGPWPFP
jgi:hypothetical protein